MVLFNYATRELTAKIVYYGPGLCGKTTNLEFIHRSLPDKTKGKMLSLATQTDRTLFFDFLPLDLGTVKGMKTRIQLYTVPGQVFYDATRKLVLKGADGVVFVVDSQKEMLDSNLESWENLKVNLAENSLDISTIPVIIQFNKRDLPNVLSVKELNKKINDVKASTIEAIALTGQGVQETLREVSNLVLKNLSSRLVKDDKSVSAVSQEAREKAPESREEEKPSVAAPKQEEELQELPAMETDAEIPLHLEPLGESAGESAALEEIEELEELEEVPSPPPPPSRHKKTKRAERTQEVELVPDQEEESVAAAPAPVISARKHAAAVRAHVTAPGESGEINIPVELDLTQEGQDINLQISIRLKIHVRPKP